MSKVKAKYIDFGDGPDQVNITSVVPTWTYLRDDQRSFFVQNITPTDQGGADLSFIKFVSTITPSENITDNYFSLQIVSAMEGPNDSQDFSSIHSILNKDGAGTARVFYGMNHIMGFGDGSTAASLTNHTGFINNATIRGNTNVGGLTGFNSNMTVESGATLSEINAVFLAGTFSGTITGAVAGVTFNPDIETDIVTLNAFTSNHFQNGTITNYNGLFLGPSGGVGAVNNYHGVNVNPDVASIGEYHGGRFSLSPSTALTGFVGVEVNNGSVIDINFEGYQCTNTGAVGQSVFGYAFNNTGSVAQDLFAFIAGTAPGTVGGQVVGFDFASQIDSQNFTGVSISQAGVAVENSIGLSFFDSGNSGGFIGLSVLKNGDTTDPARYMKGVQVDLNGNSAEYIIGQSLNLGNGNASQGAIGLQIEVANVTQSNGHAPTSISTEGGQLSIQSLVPPLANEGFQSGNGLLIAAQIPLGSPVTNTEYIGTAMITLLQAEDDMGLGPIGIGFAASAAAGQISVTAGHTMDAVSQMIVGMGISNTSTGGSVTDYSMYRALGVFDQGGILNIDNIFGLHLDAGMSSGATNAWGIFVDDPVLENYFAKSIAIGTATKKVSAPQFGLEVANEGLFDVPLVTDGNVEVLHMNGTNNTTVDGSNVANGFTSNMVALVQSGATNDKGVGGGVFAVQRGDGTDDGVLDSINGFTIAMLHHAGAAGVTNIAIGLDIITIPTTGTLTDLYDIRAQRAPAGGDVTNHYGVYIVDDPVTPIQNWLAGSTVFGGTSFSAPTTAVDMNSDTVRLRTARTITNATDSGNQGDICWDNDFIYVCIATDTWVRTSLATW